MMTQTLPALYQLYRTIMKSLNNNTRHSLYENKIKTWTMKWTQNEIITTGRNEINIRSILLDLDMSWQFHHPNIASSKYSKTHFSIFMNKNTICIDIIFQFTLLNWTRSSVCQNTDSQHCVLCPRPITYFSSIACHFLLLYPPGSRLWTVWPGSP